MTEKSILSVKGGGRHESIIRVFKDPGLFSMC